MLKGLLKWIVITVVLVLAVDTAIAQCGIPGTPPCKKASSKTTKTSTKKKSTKSTSRERTDTYTPITISPLKRICLSPDVPRLVADCPEDVKPSYIPADKDRGYDIAIVDVDKALLRDEPLMTNSTDSTCPELCVAGINSCTRALSYCEARFLYKKDMLVILDRTPTNNWLNVINVETAKEGWVWMGHVNIYYTRNPKTSVPEFEERRTGGETNPQVTISNETDRTLTLRLGTQVYTIDPYSTRTINLYEGNYKFYASVPRAYPLMGEKYYSKGYRYTWNFYIGR